MSCSRYIDISTVLCPELVVYEGDPLFEIHPVASYEACGYRTSVLRMGTHAGTHIDPAAHLIADGASLDKVSLDALCGPARVLDLRGSSGAIGVEELRGKLDGVERVLLKTVGGQSMGADGAYLSVSAARYLRGEGKVRLVGTESLSVDALGSAGLQVHRELLCGKDPVVVLEGLDLREAEPGDYELLCLPLRIAGADGGPARAVLRKNS